MALSFFYFPNALQNNVKMQSTARESRHGRHGPHFHTEHLQNTNKRGFGFARRELRNPVRTAGAKGHTNPPLYEDCSVLVENLGVTNKPFIDKVKGSDKMAWGPLKRYQQRGLFHSDSVSFHNCFDRTSASSRVNCRSCFRTTNPRPRIIPYSHKNTKGSEVFTTNITTYR